MSDPEHRADAEGIEARLARLSPAQRALFERRTAQRGGAAPDGVRRLGPDEPAPLTFAQERFWFLEQLDPGSPELTLCGTGRVRRAVDADAFEFALGRVVARHEALGARIATEDGRPGLHFDAGGLVRLERVAAEHVPAPERDGFALADARAMAATRIDLARGPLLRVRLLRFGPRDFGLVLALHHAIADGWSLGLLLAELTAEHDARTAGGTADLPAPALRLRDFAAWQRERLTPTLRERRTGDWRSRFGGHLERPDLPLDRPRPARLAAASRRSYHDVAPMTVRAAAALASALGTSSFTVYLAALQVFLGRIGRSERFLVGTSSAGRDVRDFAGLIGPLVQTLAVPATVELDRSIAEHVARTHADLRGALEHDELPFEQLVEALGVPRDPSRTPLFDVFFDKAPARALPEGWNDGGGELDFDPGWTQFDLAIGLEDRGRAARLVIDYRTALFEPETVDRITASFFALLKGLVNEPERPVGELPLVDAQELELQRRLGAGPATPADPPTISARLAHWAELDPTAACIADPNGRRSRAEFLAAVRCTAARLRAAGVRRGSTVGVLAARDRPSVIAAHACWWLGAAYLPLDASDPPERFAAILEDGRPCLLLGRPAALDSLQALGQPTLPLDVSIDERFELFAPAARPEDPAYAIFSSGSTGRPKGSLISHAALANHSAATLERFDFGTDERFVLRTPPTFDSAIWELCIPIAAGAELRIPAPELQRDLPALLDWVVAEGATVVQVVPSLLGAWIEGLRGRTTRLRHVISAGEALPAEVAAGFFEAAPEPVRLHNLYGPSECGIDTLWHEVPRESAPLGGARASVPIGRPLPGVRVEVLDARGQPLPRGVTGELAIEGAGVAVADLSSAHARAPRFERDGSRYRSGDLVRWLPGGDLEFVGRADEQVQLQGVRVELGEVEAALRALPGVAEAAAVVTGELGRARLVAWFVPEQGSDVNATELLEQLSERLPSALRPAELRSLESLPLGPTEKLDRRALEAMGRAAAPLERRGAPPVTPTERALAAAFSELLGVDPVLREDDFFRLGGNSLLATRLAARAAATLSRELPLRLLFEHPQLAALARALDVLQDAQPDATGAPLPRRSAAEFEPVSSAVERLWILEQLAPGTRRSHVPAAFALEGPLELEHLNRSWAALLERHPVLSSALVERDGRPCWTRAAAPPSPCREIDLRGLTDDQQRRRVEAWIGAPFDLSSGPLARLNLFLLGAERQLLLIEQHHIVTDATSIRIVLEELLEGIAAAAEGRATRLAPAACGLHDATDWRAAAEHGPGAEARLAARVAELCDAPVELVGLGDRARPQRPSFAGAQRTRALPGDWPARVRATAAEAATTPYAWLLATFATALARWTGTESFVIGTTELGRDRPEFESLVGLFVNLVPLRLDVDLGAPFASGVAAAHAAAGRALDARGVPFERLVEELFPERDPARHPLFQVSFDLVPSPPDELLVGALRCTDAQTGETDVEHLVAKLDLSLAIEDRGASWVARIDFASELFEAETIERWFRAWVRLVEAALERPTACSGQLAWIGATERSGLLQLGRGPELDPATAELDELLRARGQDNPLGLSFGERTWSRAELWQRVEERAAQLRELGVGPGLVVGICLPRGFGTLLEPLAVWRAGAAWLTLDPNDPPLRHDDLLQRAAAALRIDTAGVHRLREASPKSSSPTPEDPAYLIPTSGTTGEPKLVVVSRAGLVSLLLGVLQTFELGAAPRSLSRTSLAFDAALLEFAPIFAAGGSVTIAPDAAALDPAAVAALIAPAGIDTLVATSSWCGLLFDAELPDGALDSLRTVWVGGEAARASLPAQVAERAPRARLFNLYGPAEATVNTTWHACGPETEGPIPIGRPVPGTQLFVLDATGDLALPGRPGELAIAGPSVALGYRGAAAADEARFGQVDLGAGMQRVYRSGDRVRWRADGALDFLGRIDRELELAGRRVDAAEIETALLAHPAVREAAITAREGEHGTRLVAHVATDLDLESLTRALGPHLKRRLPRALAPRLFDALDELPRTVGGKLDLAALGARPIGPSASREGTPATPQELPLLGLAARLFDAPELRPTDDLYASGATSLGLIQLALRARSELGLALPPEALFAQPTVRGALAHLARPTGPRPALLHAEAVLDPSLIPPIPIRTPRHARPHVLLTGATGFLGAHLAQELARAGAGKLTALVRAESRELAERRLHGVFNAYGIDPPPPVEVVLGDLAQPGLGFAPDVRDALAADVDRIVHCGAAVDFFAGYEQLRAANVGSTETLIALALDSGAQLHFVSTLGVFFSPSHGPDERVDEATSLEAFDDVEHGYEQTKWVAEALVRQATVRGLTACVHRPGRIAAHSVTGAINAADFTQRTLEGCRRIGAVPDLHTTVDLTPVDAVARAIALLAVNSAPPPVTHLANPDPVSFQELCSTQGAGLELVPYAEWLARAERAVAADPEHPLLPLLGPLLAAGPDDPSALLLDMVLPRVDQERTRRALARAATAR